jgi:tRNA threonylcarbamoyl adenosine modification protein (Sua5/YciO/YrdC/YwlC family)
MKRWAIEDAPSEEQLEEIAATLASGGVVLLPTDTIYGLHAVSTDPDAIARISVMKGREEGKAFLLLAASTAQLEALGCVVPAILNDIWPASLTAVLQQGEHTLAARIPTVGWLRALAERLGPIVSTSANRSGEPPITTPSELPRELQMMLDGVVDAGPRKGEVSAIVDFTGNEPRFIRDGEVLFTQNLRKRLRKSL